MTLLSSTLCTKSQYHKLYQESISNPEKFWSDQAKRINWYKPWSKVFDYQFKKPVHIKWFIDAKLNASYNCIDRHLSKFANHTAIIWEPDNPQEDCKKFTYKELHEEVCSLANVLKKHGVKKGDRVTIYLPMIPEAAFSILACARIGAIHSVVFGGFSSEALVGRIKDCESTFIITANEGLRAGKTVLLKSNVDKALEQCPQVKKVLVVQRTNNPVHWNEKRDLWYHEEKSTVGLECDPEVMDSEDPLFILYTSGSTGKPKGVLHTTGGYLTHVSLTHELVFDYRPGQIYWCTADVGWVTGHSYIIYGPLANAATTVMFEGVPNYPSPARHWEVIDKHKVEIYYTAPTSLRSLMREGNSFVKSTSRSSLRVIGSVGEPLNPEASAWYYSIVGENRCPIVDTWWQTETGGILLTPLPGSHEAPGGSVGLPFFGVNPVIVDNSGKELPGESTGHLCIQGSWPGQMRTVYNDHSRFEETYFSQYPGFYFTGDGCRRDQNGFYWITGRVDDVLNVSGHRIGTAEVESALVGHKIVSEAAVVGFPHDIKGQGIYAFVTLMTGIEENPALQDQLNLWLREQIGPIAKLDEVCFTPALPKTRSGKIMRRILRKIAEGDLNSLGDISTLSNPEVVDYIVNRTSKEKT